MNIGPYLYEKMQGLLFQRSKHEYLSAVLDQLDLPEGCRVLDVGCGTGQDVPLFMNSKRFQYKGIDISRSCIDRARRSFPGCLFTVSDGVSMQEESAPYDLIWLNSVLHHINDESAVMMLAKMVSMLAGAGRLVVYDMIMPEKGFIGRLGRKCLIAADRGGYCRSSLALREMVSGVVSIVEQHTSHLGAAGLTLYEMSLIIGCIKDEAPGKYSVSR